MSCKLHAASLRARTGSFEAGMPLGIEMATLKVERVRASGIQAEEGDSFSGWLILMGLYTAFVLIELLGRAAVTFNVGLNPFLELYVLTYIYQKGHTYRE